MYYYSTIRLILIYRPSEGGRLSKPRHCSQCAARAQSCVLQWFSWKHKLLPTARREPGSSRAAGKRVTTRPLRPVLHEIFLEPTRKSITLDLIMTNRPDLVNRIQVMPGLSDHDIGYTEMMYALPVENRSHDMCQSITEQTGLAARIIDAESSNAVDHLRNTFKDEIMAGVNKFIPQSKIKTKDSCPWITGELHKKIKRRDQAYKARRQASRV